LGRFSIYSFERGKGKKKKKGKGRLEFLLAPLWETEGGGEGKRFGKGRRRETLLSILPLGCQ